MGLKRGRKMVDRNDKWDGNPDNACLTLHQPWASLLVHGIKRVEARSWPAPFTGTLWIHAAGKVPDKDTIKAVEEFYKQLYAFEGVTDLKFPERYPLQVLVGCVEVVGCIEREELESWDDVSQGVRLEALHDFCWLCEDPQKLIVNWETRGYPGIFNLEEKVLWAAERSLGPIEAPLPIKFPELVYDDSEHSEDTLSSTPGSPVDGVDVKGSKKCKLDEDVPPARSEDTLSSTPGSPVDGIDMDLKESKPDEDVAPAHSEDTLSSTPGSPVDGIDMDSKESKADKELPPALKAALEGVRAIVGQFSKKPDYPPTGSNW